MPALRMRYIAQACAKAACGFILIVNCWRFTHTRRVHKGRFREQLNVYVLDFQLRVSSSLASLGESAREFGVRVLINIVKDYIKFGSDFENLRLT